MKFVDLALISVSVLIVACSGDDPEPAPSSTAASSNMTNTVTSGATSGGTTQTSSGTPTVASTVASNTAATTGGGTVTGTTGGDMTGVGGASTVGTVTGDGSTATGGSTSAGGSTGTTSDTTGTTTAGGSTGAGGSMGGTGSGGLVAVATITPTTAAPSGWDDFSATATFTQEGDMVTLVIEATGCPDGLHIAHLHANLECGDDGEAAGPHWIPNGEVLEDMECESGTGSYTHSESTDVWSIGGDAETDITQHSYMVHALSAAENAGAKAACGSIVAQ